MTEYNLKIEEKNTLPRTTPSCHASTAIYFENRLIHAYFGGSREGSSDVHIYIHNLFGDNKTHKIPKPLHKFYLNLPTWNPILFQSENRLYMSYKIGKFCDSWATFIIPLSDILEGKKKTADFEGKPLDAGLNFSVKTKPLIIDDFIVCGSSVETAFSWASYIEVYDKNLNFLGRSLPISALDSGTSLIQPALWMDKDKNLHSLFRSRTEVVENKFVYYSKSKKTYDGTVESLLNWEKPIVSNLSNPNSSIDVVYKENLNKIFVVLNPLQKYRANLAIVPIDPNKIKLTERELQFETENFHYLEGASIPMLSEAKEIFKNRDMDVVKPEFSYPYIIDEPALDNGLRVCYTYYRKFIVSSALSYKSQ